MVRTAALRFVRASYGKQLLATIRLPVYEYKSAREHAAGAVTGSDVPDIHQLGNPDVSERDLVTLHVYAPPLGVLHTYKPGSATIDLYVPDDTDPLI